MGRSKGNKTVAKLGKKPQTKINPPEPKKDGVNEAKTASPRRGRSRSSGKRDAKVISPERSSLPPSKKPKLSEAKKSQDKIKSVKSVAKNLRSRKTAEGESPSRADQVQGGHDREQIQRGAESEGSHDEPIVGSARSLIKSIKKRREGLNVSAKEEKTRAEVHHAVTPVQGHSTNDPISPTQGDGVDLGVSSSDDDYSEEGEFSKSEWEETDHSVDEPNEGSDGSRERFSEPEQSGDSTGETGSEGSYDKRPRKKVIHHRGRSKTKAMKRFRESSGETSDGLTDDEDLVELKRNPKFKKYMQKLKEKNQRSHSLGYERNHSRSKTRRRRDRRSSMHGRSRSRKRSTHRESKSRSRTRTRGKRRLGKRGGLQRQPKVPMVKSLSDTMIYRPALQKLSKRIPTVIPYHNPVDQGTPVGITQNINKGLSVDYLSNVVDRLSMRDRGSARQRSSPPRWTGKEANGGNIVLVPMRMSTDRWIVW